MNFSTDRDLLSYEPNIFVDIPFAGQEYLSVTDGVVTGTTLTSASADFVNAQVAAASVILINGVAHEVIAQTNATTLAVSRLRSQLSDPAIAPGDGSAMNVVARTFGPQATRVHDALLRMLGIETDDPQFAVSQDQIISLSLMARLEVLGTLHRVYTGAVVLAGDNDVLQRKARAYLSDFHATVRQSIVWLDLDGDGKGDTRRHLGVGHLMRA